MTSSNAAGLLAGFPPDLGASAAVMVVLSSVLSVAILVYGWLVGWR